MAQRPQPDVEPLVASDTMLEPEALLSRLHAERARLPALMQQLASLGEGESGYTVFIELAREASIWRIAAAELSKAYIAFTLGGTKRTVSSNDNGDLAYNLSSESGMRSSKGEKHPISASPICSDSMSANSGTVRTVGAHTLKPPGNVDIRSTSENTVNDDYGFAFDNDFVDLS